MEEQLPRGIKAPKSTNLIDARKPNHSCFTIKDTTDGKGRGIFAARCIEKGSLLLEESPLLQIDDARDLEEEKLEKILEKKGRQASEDFNDLSTGTSEKSKFHLHGQKQHHLLRWNKNVFFLNDQKAGALFYLSSFFNHSCRPNASYVWNPTQHRMEFYACCDILTDEEITISYIPLRQFRTLRQYKLERTYSFKCTCIACKGTNEAQTDRERIAQMNEDKEKFSNICNQRQLVGLLEEQGLYNPDLAKDYLLLAAQLAEAGNIEEASRCLERAKRVAQDCTGASSDLSLGIEKLTEKFQYHAKGIKSTIVQIQATI